MSSMQQVKNNLEYVNAGKPSPLTVNDLAVYKLIKKIYRSRIKLPCTRCGYCQPGMVRGENPVVFLGIQ